MQSNGQSSDQYVGGAVPARGNCFADECPARLVLGHLSSKWGSLIVAALCAEGVLRFSELRARIQGISEKVLSDKLRELERDGVITRKMYPVVPPRVEYALSPLGVGAAQHVKALIKWIEQHTGDLVSAQRQYDTSAK